MKVQIDWKHLLIFIFVCGGLILITHSFWMSLGIMLLILVADYILANLEVRSRRKKDYDKKMERDNEQ
ncbi:MAG: hypothetical protein PUG09_10335 [Prevotella sp.]|nr:hypothetical protein [Prevotella sp.]